MHWLVHSNNEFNADRCRKESASKQGSARKKYGVITNIMQIGLITKSYIRNKQAIKQAARSEQRGQKP